MTTTATLSSPLAEAYKPAEPSRAFPFLPRAEVERFLKMPLSVDRTTILLQFRDWARQSAKQ